MGLRDGAPPDAPLRGCAHALLLEELLGADLPPMAPMGAALRPLQQRLRRCREYGVVMGWFGGTMRWYGGTMGWVGVIMGWFGGTVGWFGGIMGWFGGTMRWFGGS